ncbi:MAG: DUF3368 domain-containing protein [Isosphaeraceae bacterium]
MISRRVVNASPLIFLTKVGLLEVLHQQAVPVLVPDVVMAEISSLGAGDPAVQAVQQAGRIRVVPAPPAPPSVTNWKLDDGESSVIAVALQHSGSMAILDDLAARRCAQAMRLPMQGTLGLVLVAKRIGLIKAVLPVVEDLEHAGMYMTARLKTQILDAAGE